jgi:hypothetical protein
LLHCFNGRGWTCTFASPKGCYDRWPILLENVCQCMWNPRCCKWLYVPLDTCEAIVASFFVLEWLKWFLYYYYCITLCKYKKLAVKFAAKHITRGLRKVVCFASMFFFKFTSLVFWFQYCCFNNEKSDKMLSSNIVSLKGNLQLVVHLFHV